MSQPASLTGVLSGFAVCFTTPTFRTFTAMVVGLVGRTSRRTVCGMWIGAGLSALVHHGRAHRFFSHARWSPDRLGLAIAALIVERLMLAGAAVEVAVDDTLFHRDKHPVGCYARGPERSPAITKYVRSLGRDVVDHVADACVDVRFLGVSAWRPDWCLT